MAKQAEERPVFVRSRQRFEDAGDVTAHRTSVKQCGADLNEADQEVFGQATCPAMGTYHFTYHGDRFHMKGECDNGHVTERYGAVEGPVVD